MDPPGEPFGRPTALVSHLPLPTMLHSLSRLGCPAAPCSWPGGRSRNAVALGEQSVPRVTFASRRRLPPGQNQVRMKGVQQQDSCVSMNT